MSDTVIDYSTLKEDEKARLDAALSLLEKATGLNIHSIGDEDRTVVRIP